MSESGRTEWARQIERSLAALLAEVAALRRRLDDLECVVARLARGERDDREEWDDREDREAVEANAT